MASIKHVLSSMPIHVLSVFDVPKVVIDKLNAAMAIFFWHDSDNHQRKHWISWEAVTSVRAKGGLGIRKLVDVMWAFRMKMAWKIQTTNSLCVEFMRAK